MPFSIPPSCESLFRTAGWYPGRRVPIDLYALSTLKTHDSAHDLLSEFGGLHIGHCGPGRDQATSDIQFLTQASPEHRFNIIDLTEFEAENLFPLGYAHHLHIELYLGIADHLFAYLIPTGELLPIAPAFPNAIEKLLLGYSF